MAAEIITSIAPVAAIVRLAEQYPVFPCRRTAETIEVHGRPVTVKPKSPFTRRGFLDATQDENQIRAWWARWPDALVGVPTGASTGLVVVDYDHGKAAKEAHEWIGENSNALLATRTHGTLSGGKHYLYRNPDGRKYRSSVGLTLGGVKRAGIDSRAEGGYIVWWPLHGADKSGTIAPLPAGLIDEYLIEAKPAAPLPSASPEKWQRDRQRVVAALAWIEPGEYDTWQRIGAALHLASGGSDDGFDLWHAWSSGDLTGETPRNYAGVDDCRARWGSFRHTNDRIATLGTVFHHAKANGWAREEAPPDLDLPPIEAYADDSAGGAGAPAEEDAVGAPLLTLRPLHEIVAERREPEWLIDDVLEANVLAVLAGPRSSFKSFVALDWGMRIAVAGQAVVILSGEGAGLDRRADAWLRTHGNGLRVEDLPVFALERPLNLNQDTDLVLLKGAIERLGRAPALVIVDTFSKFSAGLDENDNGEVSTYLARLSVSIRQAFGSTVLLVAHSGHGDSGRPRGASALMANPDAEYIIARPSPTAMTITVSRERFKDSPSLPPIGYEAQVIDLKRTDRRGRPVTSLALAASEAIIAPAGKRYAGVNQERAVTALRELHRANPACRFLTSQEIAELAKAQGINRKRRLEVVTWLVAAGILTPSVGGHAFDPTNL